MFPVRACLALAACIALVLPASLRAASGSAKAQEPEARTRNIASIIQRVEQGLMPAIVVGGRPQPALTIADEMRARHVPGVSVAVIHDYQIDWARSYGLTRAGDPHTAPVTSHTRFQVASISKTVTAVAALRMVQDGRLKLDAPVNSELKSWQLPENDFTRVAPVTLNKLLGHTAGINAHTSSGGCKNPDGPAPTRLQALNGTPPADHEAVTVRWPVGEGFHYSNHGYLIVQQLMVDNAGPHARKKPDRFADVLQREVFDPAGMRDSTIQSPRLTGYGASKENFAWPHDDTGKLRRLACLGGEGVWSTATDIARLVIGVQKSVQGRGGLLSKSSAATMLTRGMEGWALGVKVEGQDDNPYFGYGGLSEGYQSFMIGYPATGDGAVVLTNGDGGMVLAMEIIRSISREYGWPDVKPVSRTAVTLDAAKLQRFTGSYLSKDGLGPFSIRVNENQADAPLVAETITGPLRLLASGDNALFSVDRDLVFTFDSSPAGDTNGGSIAFGKSFTDAFERVAAESAAP